MGDTCAIRHNFSLASACDLGYQLINFVLRMYITKHQSGAALLLIICIVFCGFQRTPELFESECSVQNSKLSDWSRSSACLSVKSSSSNSVSSQKSSMSKCGSQRQSPGRSTPDTETVIDVQEDFNFIMSDDIQKCNKDSTYPDENILRRFIRDAAACLQGLVGSESISYSDFIVAATKICDTFPILWDPRPASFPPAKKIISFLGRPSVHDLQLCF